MAVASLLLAATLTACIDEGPSVTTAGPDNDLAQGEGTPGTESVGDPSGPGARRGDSTDADDLVDAIDEAEPKPSAATTTSDDPDDTTTTTDDESPDEGDNGDGSSDADDGGSDNDDSSDDSNESDNDDGSSNGNGSDGNGPGSLSGLAATSVSYVNDRRSEEGLGTLAGDPKLTEMADNWAHQMIADDELHHNPNLGSEMPAGYNTIGENIAYSSNPGNIDDMWWNSDGHRANILGSSYTHMGVAFVEDGQGTTWAVQVFAG